jgi:hypothetical protein
MYMDLERRLSAAKTLEVLDRVLRGKRLPANTRKSYRLALRSLAEYTVSIKRVLTRYPVIEIVSL